MVAATAGPQRPASGGNSSPYPWARIASGGHHSGSGAREREYPQSPLLKQARSVRPGGATLQKSRTVAKIETGKDRQASLGIAIWQASNRIEKIDCNIIRDGILSKFSRHGELEIPRRVVLTKTHLDLLQPEDEKDEVIDTIPLSQIVDIKFLGPTENTVGGEHGVGSPNPLRKMSSNKGIWLKRYLSSMIGLPKSRRDSHITGPDSMASNGPESYASTTPKTPKISKSCSTTEALDYCNHLDAPNSFSVATEHLGFNGGKVYSFKAESEDECQAWVSEIRIAASNHRQAVRRYKTWKHYQIMVRKLYESNIFQTLVVLLILSNFGLVVVQTQERPDPDSEQARQYWQLEVVFLCAFFLELSINFIGNFFWRFARNSWNLFDVFVVFFSLIQVALPDLPALSQLRVFRTCRLLRVFGRMSGLRRTINCLSAAFLPVVESLAIGCIVCSIYATIGVEYFAQRHDESFGNFNKAIFTVFGIVAFQRWPHDDLPAFEGDNSVNIGVLIYLYSFVAIVVWVLLQIICATLLEHFFEASARDKEETAKRRAAEFRIPHVLDPLMDILSYQFETEQDLSKRIQHLFVVLDVDNTSTISFEELAQGIRKLNFREPLELTKEDYEEITEMYELCCSEKRLDVIGFETIMRKQLQLYTQRHIASAISMDNASTEIEALLTGIKLMLINGNSAAFSSPPYQSETEASGPQKCKRRNSRQDAQVTCDTKIEELQRWMMRMHQEIHERVDKQFQRVDSKLDAIAQSIPGVAHGNPESNSKMKIETAIFKKSFSDSTSNGSLSSTALRGRFYRKSCCGVVGAYPMATDKKDSLLQSARTDDGTPRPQSRRFNTALQNIFVTNNSAALHHQEKKLQGLQMQNRAGPVRRKFLFISAPGSPSAGHNCDTSAPYSSPPSPQSFPPLGTPQ